jgi:hypothetical protein
MSSFIEYLYQPAPQYTRWDIMFETVRYIFPTMLIVCVIYVGYYSYIAKHDVGLLEYRAGLFIRYCLLYISLTFVSLMIYGGYTVLVPRKQTINEVSPK